MGAREHNLREVDVDIPRDALVVFSGVSGSGKSSLALGTIYAEAQRRYFESVAPYARRLIDQVGVPAVDSIEGLPPAVALQQQRGTPSVRSSVGSVTTLSSLLRMLYSRTGRYPPSQPMLYAEDFSPNTAQGACAFLHGKGSRTPCCVPDHYRVDVEPASCPCVARTCRSVRALADTAAGLPQRPGCLSVRPAGAIRTGPALGAGRRRAHNPAHRGGPGADVVNQGIATAMQRVEAVLRRRPNTGLHEDASAIARWQGGTRVVAHHANGAQVSTDMPGEFGGSGDQITPGWLLRASFASCTATCIAMFAAAEGIELDELEVQAGSYSDTRGLVGLVEADGTRVSAGPRDMQMHVRIGARGVPAERLRGLVERSYRRSPMACAMEDAVPVALHIEVDSD